ncbi:unnamed protein product [Caenorhabditis angaria]|uniref:Peptidase M13 C-terminal domain-containing protein n=1 Tax=Caenorhabditis angaria TaxID=860376 RepID=A0A9P1N0J6_9PELO|nr:unnamed protein product [Caenorhabditis angaria]
MNMNLKADPCEDFYEFACGNYEKNHEVPIGEWQTSMIDEMRRNVEKWLENYLESWMHEDLNYPYELVINYTRSCINEKRKAAKNHKDLKEIIDLKFGRWHLLDNKTFNNEFNNNWEILAGNLSLFGIHTFIKPVVALNPNNIYRMVLGISTNLKTVDDDETEEEREMKREIRFYFIRDVFEMIGIDVNDTKVIDDLVDFDRNVTDLLSYTSGNYTNEGFQTSFGEFKELYPNINFDAYFVTGLNKSIPNFLLDNTTIQNINPDFFKKFDEFISGSANETIKNYLMWKLVEKSLEYMSVEYRYSLSLYLTSINEQSDWLKMDFKSCAEQALKMFPIPVGREYIKKHYTKNDTMEIEKIFGNLKKVMIDKIKNSTWMQRKSKEGAIAKIEKMTAYIGYPYLFDYELEVEKPYGKKNLNPNAFLKNFLKISKINQKQYLADLEYHSLSNWDALVTQVNAHYAYQRNTIIVPAAFIAFPQFVQNSPIAINYGGIASSLAHEMTHGFDSQGRFYDDYGEKFDWWDELTSKEYDIRSQCFIEQYDLEVENKTGLNFDGTLTLDENIADNVGVKIAWLAYKSQKTLDNRKLPKLEKYTSDQLFFISYADATCLSADAVSRKDAMQNAHTFGATRLNVPLRNFPKFGEVFKCKIGSGMMPNENETCRIW